MEALINKTKVPFHVEANSIVYNYGSREASQQELELWRMYYDAV
jgi:hypothetical protein